MFHLIPEGRGRGHVGSPPPSRSHPLARLQDDLTGLFEQFVSRFPNLREIDSESLRLWDCNLSETDNELLVRAEVPGFDVEELDVQLHENTLTIRAEKRLMCEGATGRGQRTNSRKYRRTVTLPHAVDPDRVQATYRNGVLEVHLTKTTQAQVRHISVQSVGGSSSGRPLRGGIPAASPPAGAGEEIGTPKVPGPGIIRDFTRLDEE